MQEGLLLYKKVVDLSLMTEGFSIPTEFQQRMYERSQIDLQHGESRTIELMIDGVGYKASFKNQGFDQKRYPNHPDVVQIRYPRNGELAKKLQSLFSHTYDYILSQRAITPRGQQIRPQQGCEEYIALYTTQFSNRFLVEYITLAERQVQSQLLTTTGETIFEADINLRQHDEMAALITEQRLMKIRKMDRSICDALKRLYDYRCQITGERVGEPYGCDVVEAHHIEYFTQSQNNDISNIVILNPSFHRIIHRTNPHFNTKTLTFEFPNGVSEPLKLNKHLNPT